MKASIIFLIVGGVIAIVLGIIFWQLKKEDIKRKTLIYLMVSVILAALPGFLGITVRQTPSIAYLASLLIFVIYGSLHVWLMYGLYWSRRASGDPSRDSFLPEFVFTLLLTVLGVLAFSANFNAWDSENYWQSNFLPLFSGVVIAFPLPFLFIKAYDFAMQIKAPDYEKKAEWSDFSNALAPDPTTKLRFVVAHTLKDENNPFRKKDSFRIEIAPEDILGNIFRYGVEELNDVEPGKKIIDLEEDQYTDIPRLWWLFKVKFRLGRPNTWNRKIRYLDPFAKAEENLIKNGDTIIAKRVPFN